MDTVFYLQSRTNQVSGRILTYQSLMVQCRPILLPVCVFLFPIVCLSVSYICLFVILQLTVFFLKVYMHARLSAYLIASRPRPSV